MPKRPTEQELQKAFDLEPDEAHELIQEIDAVDEADDHNRAVEEAMDAADEILDGFGVEAIEPEDAWVDRFWQGAIGIYVNLGDTYDTTLIYDTEKGEFLIGSWGDFLEAWEAENVEEEEEEEEVE